MYAYVHVKNANDVYVCRVSSIDTYSELYIGNVLSQRTAAFFFHSLFAFDQNTKGNLFAHALLNERYKLFALHSAVMEDRVS